MIRFTTLNRLSPLTRAVYGKFTQESNKGIYVMESHLVHLYDALDDVADALTEIEERDETCYPIYKIYLSEFSSLDKTFRKCLNQTIKLIKVQQKG